MKKYLFKNDRNLYKANLHCHTTVSDGGYTPEEIKKLYKENGYSVVAFTDHDVLVPHPELKDEDFLPLNGFEVELDQKVEGKDWQNSKTCHICFIGMSEDNITMPFNRDDLYIWGNALTYLDRVKFTDSPTGIERKYCPETVSKMMSLGREAGFFVTYNHPHWSMETYNDYINYDGMYAMEIYNHDCVLSGFNDYCPQVYDELLRSGKNIFCVAADDNHNRGEDGPSPYDSCGGYVMIRAEKLEYKDITNALLKGDFYASNGAHIENVWYDTETKRIHIECKDAKKVVFQKGKRTPGVVYAEGDESLNEASCPVLENDGYVRITMYDKNGKFAATQAYYVEELYGTSGL